MDMLTGKWASFAFAVVLFGCGHSSEGGGARSSGAATADSDSEPEAEVVAVKVGAKVQPAVTEPAVTEPAAAERAVHAVPVVAEQKCDRSLSWEARKACWAKKGVWPHAPAMSEAEWQALDIHSATLEEVRALIPRAVTGDVCAALASEEPHSWKRWSAALPVELKMGIWVVEGPDAFQIMREYFASLNTGVATAGIVDCGDQVVYFHAGGGGARRTPKRLRALPGLRLVKEFGFPVTLSAGQVNECTSGHLWHRRCLLRMRAIVIDVCPRLEHGRAGNMRKLCPLARKFLAQ